MHPISDNKLLHHIKRVGGDFRPITADVFLTNYCNNRCSWCTYNRWELSEGSRYMCFDDFKKYAERLIDLGVQGIILTGGGEPTINKDFDKITEWLEMNKISYGINTNFNVLKYIKPDYLKVSLDGYDEESYERIRGVKAYIKARENIVRYADWKKEHSPKTNLGIQIVATAPEIVYKFYEANKDLPVDYIVFRPIESTGGEYYSDVKSILDARLIVKEVKNIAENDDRVMLNYKWDYLQMSFKECSAHWAQIAMDEEGNVLYCCHKPYEIIGHILDEDILQKYAEAKTNMKMCDVPCRLTAPNMFMDKIKEEVENKSFI